MIERNNKNQNPNQNHNQKRSSLPITATGYNTTTSNPNYQLSGMQPNYTYNGAMNLSFDSSVIPQNGFPSKEALEGDVSARQQYINSYNEFSPVSEFLRSENNSAKLENLRDFSQNDFKQNFTDNKPELYMLNTKNKHNTLYNNLNEELLKEFILEYRLNIDSYDRDIELYPNPFEYVVNLGPIVNSGINPTVVSKSMKQEIRENEKKNNKKYSKNFNPGNLNNINNPNHSSFKGVTLSNNQIIETETKNLNPNDPNNPLNSIEITADAFLFNSPELIVQYTNLIKENNQPYLNRNFDNVKFIRLDTGILPKFNTVKINYEWELCRKSNFQKKYIKDDYDRLKSYIILNSRYIPDDMSEYNLQTDRFVQISVKEIRTSLNLGTNPVSDKCFMLVFDKNLGILYWRGIPYSANKNYRDSLLGSIDRLSIKFFNSWGKPLFLDTSQIDYEKNQILGTDIINPKLLILENFVNNPKAVEWLIEKMTEIIKCFIIINFDIECLIPFYSALNDNDNKNEINNSPDYTKSVKPHPNLVVEDFDFVGDEIINMQMQNIKSSSKAQSSSSSSSEYPNEFCFLKNCKTTTSKIVVNQNIFEVKNIYEELNEFVTTNGFVSVKKVTKNGKIVNININQYIANIIWFDSSPKYKDFIKFNLESFSVNYKNYGFNVLDTLKNELISLPKNKFFQNYISFVMGLYSNELNTKIDFTQS